MTDAKKKSADDVELVRETLRAIMRDDKSTASDKMVAADKLLQLNQQDKPLAGLRLKL